VRALLARPGADDLVDARVGLEHPDQLGDLLVLVRHVRVGPDDDVAVGHPAPDPAGRAGAAVAGERHDAQRGHPRLDGAQHREGAVGRGVVDREDLVAQPGGGQGGVDPVQLGLDVLGLVVAGQDDGALQPVAVRASGAR
jgi:hypothetical protein